MTQTEHARPAPSTRSGRVRSRTRLPRTPEKEPTARDTLFGYLLGTPDIAGKKVVDLFAGGGGVSVGIEMALGRSPDVAVNHDAEAIAMHSQNHPTTRHYRSDVFEVEPREAVGDCPVALLWLSPDCKHHSRAKGGKPLDKRIRALAWVGLKWAGQIKPDVIILENVPDFQHWSRLIPLRGFTERTRDGRVKKVTPEWTNAPKRTGAACRRWKPGMPKQKPPRGPIMVNDAGETELIADKRAKYRGRTFQQFVKELRKLGYEVEYKILRADEYGVPTIRERFFLIARRDGHPIRWPEPTHGADRLPVRTAAECIDWSLPTRSIFGRAEQGSKDLAERTLRRVAMGMDRYVLGAAEPFLVKCNHGGHDSRQRSVNEPIVTLTGSRDAPGLVMPSLTPMSAMHLTKFQQNSHGQMPSEPLDTIMAGATRFGVVDARLAPFLAPMYSERPGQAPRCGSINRPLPTIVTGANGARMVNAHLRKLHKPDLLYKTQVATLIQFNGTANAQPMQRPLGTVSTVDRFGLMQASVLRIDQQNWCSRSVVPADEPLRTITTKNGQALMTAHMLRQFGTSTARAVNTPLGSLTTGAVKDGLITSHLAPQLDERTQRGAAEVYAFLERMMPTALERLPEESRAARLVTLDVDGERFIVWDIGLRMLEPRELYRCQGFPAGYTIEFAFKGVRLSKASQVRMVGNSVPPPLVSALVGAQFGQMPNAAD